MNSINQLQTKISVLIADDEPAARRSLEVLLGSKPEVEIKCICKDGREVVDAIIKYRPDLVFLDIQMPEMDGFEVLEAVRPIYLPAFIFVTAFEHYAIKAFEKSAVDYLLKPYDDERFNISFDKAFQLISNRNVLQRLQQVESLLSFINNQSSITYSKKLSIKNNGRISFISVEHIKYIESKGNFVKIHAATESKLASYSFKELETILDPHKFVRIHKSFIVNCDEIEHIEPYFHGDYILILKSGDQLKLSRNYKEALERIIS
jgi:two-component system, LytTR family, response regulator